MRYLPYCASHHSASHGCSSSAGISGACRSATLLMLASRQTWLNRRAVSQKTVTSHRRRAHGAPQTPPFNCPSPASTCSGATCRSVWPLMLPAFTTPLHHPCPTPALLYLFGLVIRRLPPCSYSLVDGIRVMLIITAHTISDHYHTELC